MEKRKIFLTGAGGTMGGAALKELLKAERAEQYDITVLELPSERSRRNLAPFEGAAGLTIRWGDLTNYADVLDATAGADYVLHAAAFIPPAADHQPDKAWVINVGAAENIVNAIKAQPNPDAVKLVNIGTVAELGDRLPPIHVGRTGDPILPSVYDMYACSKVAAERIVAESGLRYWVSLRQTFITSPKVSPDPIMFHSPLDTCFEICTVNTAGLVLAQVTSEDVPDAFWRRFYNIGGGPKARLTYFEFLQASMALSGITDIRQVFDRNWFALRNFHCHWFEDSHILDGYLHHQGEGVAEYLREAKRAMPFSARLAARLTPNSLIKQRVFAPLAHKTPDAPLYWIKQDVEPRIAAFYKSKEAFAQIPDWDAGGLATPDYHDFERLDHGYDENMPTAELRLSDMQGAAQFRGGQCLSRQMAQGDLYTPLAWRCAFGHVFEATPNLILKGGHWCPDCAPPDWNHDEEARHNPFVAQVWHQQHSPDERNRYPKELLYDLLLPAANT